MRDVLGLRRNHHSFHLKLYGVFADVIAINQTTKMTKKDEMNDDFYANREHLSFKTNELPYYMSKQIQKS
jgi:hypothetical protein